MANAKGKMQRKEKQRMTELHRAREQLQKQSRPLHAFSGNLEASLRKILDRHRRIPTD